MTGVFSIIWDAIKDEPEVKRFIHDRVREGITWIEGRPSEAVLTRGQARQQALQFVSAMSEQDFEGGFVNRFSLCAALLGAIVGALQIPERGWIFDDLYVDGWAFYFPQPTGEATLHLERPSKRYPDQDFAVVQTPTDIYQFFGLGPQIQPEALANIRLDLEKVAREPRRQSELGAFRERLNSHGVEVRELIGILHKRGEIVFSPKRGASKLSLGRTHPGQTLQAIASNLVELLNSALTRHNVSTR